MQLSAITVRPLLCVLFSTYFPFFGVSQPVIRTGKDHALFIAITDYKYWPDLPGADLEVLEIAEELKKEYNFVNPDIRINPSKSQILNAITDYQNRFFDPADQLLIYLSMHGHYDDAIGALIPMDGKLDDPTYESWITHPILEALVTKIKCGHILLAIDACYSGTFGPKFKNKPDAPDWETSNDCISKCQKALQYKSRLYLTSGGKERTPTQSQFARKWMEALRQINKDGLLGYHELYAILSEATPTPMFGEFREHAVGGDFILVNKQACASTSDSTLLTVAIGVEEQTWRIAEKRGDGQIYLEDYPGGKYASQAQHLKPLAVESPSSTLTDARKSPLDGAMVFVKGGTYMMGCFDEQKDCKDDEIPTHPVTLHDFYIGKYEVTQQLWLEITGVNSSNFQGCLNCPVENVNWYDVQDFLSKLNFKYPGWNFRLPTESEWEYAAREGGKAVLFGNGKNIADPAEINFDGDVNEKSYAIKGVDRGKVMPVGSFTPNALGLYDMSGNVREWCYDWYDHYAEEAQSNPSGPNKGTKRVLRGGAWYNYSQVCRVTDRFHELPKRANNGIGFRLARSQ